MANHNGNIRTQEEMKVLFENLELKAQMTGSPTEYPGIELLATYQGKEIAVARMHVDVQERSIKVMWWPPTAFYKNDNEQYLLDFSIDEQLPVLLARIQAAE
jgi:hypothetical protein